MKKEFNNFFNQFHVKIDYETTLNDNANQQTHLLFSGKKEF